MAYEDITCEQYIRTLGEDLAGELPRADRERNARHAAGCSDCASYRRDYEAVVRTSREAGKESPAQLPADLARLILTSRQRPQ